MGVPPLQIYVRELRLSRMCIREKEKPSKKQKAQRPSVLAGFRIRRHDCHHIWNCEAAFNSQNAQYRKGKTLLHCTVYLMKWEMSRHISKFFLKEIRGLHTLTARKIFRVFSTPVPEEAWRTGSDLGVNRCYKMDFLLIEHISIQAIKCLLDSG